MTKITNKRILAIIPCYNEATSIKKVIIESKTYVEKVLVINDGSTDNTATIAQQAGATVLTHPKNLGKSAAIKTGFKYALEHDFDYIITLDGDGQHNPKEIPLLLNNVINKGHDITIGVRFGPTTEMPKWRKLGKRILDYATSIGSNGVLTDSQSGFRAFNKKAIEGLVHHMNGTSFAVESEQIIKASSLGLAIGDAHVSCKYKDLDTSTKTPTSHGVSVLTYIMWLVALRRPLLFIGIPGGLLMLIGVYFGLKSFQLFYLNQIISYPEILISLLLLIIGALLIIYGLIHNVLPILHKRTQNKKIQLEQ